MQRVFIYGSCVTRDGVSLWSDYGFELSGYVARQSLISAVAPARRGDFVTAQIASAFQRRMAEGDIVGNVVNKLTAQSDSYDLIFWDITDERLGVYPVPSGGYVSRVVDYSNGIYRGGARLGVPVHVGTAEHRKLWEHALQEFVGRLEQAGVKERLILNALPWATRDDAGASTKTAANDPQSFNAVLDEYCTIAERHGVRIARTDQECAVGSTDHQWGQAPFHYIPDTYRASLDALTAALG